MGEQLLIELLYGAFLLVCVIAVCWESYSYGVARTHNQHLLNVLEQMDDADYAARFGREKK